MAALEAGEVDVAIDLEPAVSIAENKGYRIVFSLDKFTDKQAITGISTLDETINKRPKLVQKIVSGLQEGMRILHTRPKIVFRVSKKIFPNLESNVINNALSRMKAHSVYPKTVLVDNKDWQRTLRTRIDSGDLKKYQKTNVSVDNSFAMNAMRELNIQ